MSTTTLAQVRSLVATDLDDTALQVVIDRAESELTARYGDPAGTPRTSTIYGGGTTLSLGRPAVSVASVRSWPFNAASTAPLPSDGYRLRPALGTIERVLGVGAGPYFPSDRWIDAYGTLFAAETIVEWTPTDLTGPFVAACIDLVRLDLARSAYAKEDIQMAQVRTDQPDWEGARQEIINRLGRFGPRFA